MKRDDTNLQELTRPTRRRFTLALATGWTFVVGSMGAALAMLHGFLWPSVLQERRKVWRVGKLEDFNLDGFVYEEFKRTPDGGEGFFLVNLRPTENKLIALSTVCTHLGCIPNWAKGEADGGRFICPCHGSAFSRAGMNMKGPAPRPLERFGISVDEQGNVMVDQRAVYRQEKGEWERAGSYVSL